MLEKYPHIESVFVHVEPQKSGPETVIIPVDEKKGFDARVAGQFGKAGYFIVIHIDQDRMKIDSYIDNSSLDKKGPIGLHAVKKSQIPGQPGVCLSNR